MTIIDMASVKASHKGHWFDEGAMQFFKSRVARWGYENGGLVYFVSSEKYDLATPRLYSVRVYDRTTDEIDTCGDFQQYKSYSGANKAAQRMAS